MTLEDDIKHALTPDPPIKTGRLITGRGGNIGDRVMVEVEGSPVHRWFTCATVVNSENVVVCGDRVFCATAPRTSLSRTLEYSRYRPISVPIGEFGKIKYLYKVPNGDGTFDLYLGGHVEEPVRIKTIEAGDTAFYLNNLGKDEYLINYFSFTSSGGKAITLNKNGTLYQNEFLGAGLLITLGYGYFAGSDGADVPTTIYQINQGNTLPNLPANLDTVTAGLILPVLPNVIQPDGTGDSIVAKAQNASGSRGVGLVAIGATYIATYDSSASSGIYTRSTQPITRSPTDLYLITQNYDCFDTYFTAINGFTLSSILTTDKFSLDVGFYDFLGVRSSIQNFDTFGIPSAQRSTATLVGKPSYSPD